MWLLQEHTPSFHNLIVDVRSIMLYYVSSLAIFKMVHQGRLSLYSTVKLSCYSYIGSSVRCSVDVSISLV